MVKVLVLAAVLATGSAQLAAAETATLTVKVENVSPKGGVLSLALFTAKNYHDDDHPTLSRDVEAIAPGTTVTFEGLTPGLYAIKMMQDVNRNGRFDTSWIGFPEEPYGFSNDAEPFLGEPPFRRTHFRVAPGANTITIHLFGSEPMDIKERRTAAR